MFGYDAWLSREPEYAEEPVEEEGEEELPAAPDVQEIWDTHRGEFIHEATFASGRKFYVQRTLSGAFCNDFEVVGRDFYSDGHLSADKALSWLCDDPEHWSW